jgi:hypothetical protein
VPAQQIELTLLRKCSLLHNYQHHCDNHDHLHENCHTNDTLFTHFIVRFPFMATEDEPHRFQTFVEEAIVDPKGGVLVIGIQHVFSQAYFFSATTAAGIPVASGVTTNYTYGGGRAGGPLAVQVEQWL